MPDGGQVALDWTVKVEAPIQSSASESDGEIILVLLHGLTGNSSFIQHHEMTFSLCLSDLRIIIPLISD